MNKGILTLLRHVNVTVNSALVKTTLGVLVEEFVGEALVYTKSQCNVHTPIHPTDQNLIQTLCFLLEKFIKEVLTPPPAAPTPSSSTAGTSLTASTSSVNSSIIVATTNFPKVSLTHNYFDLI